MGFTFSPLRYPGGKSRLRRLIEDATIRNGLLRGHYYEPFAGGAGVAWALLLGDLAEHVHINDIDPAIHAFWVTALDRTNEFCKKVHETQITIHEWEKQREIYNDPSNYSQLQFGFATFFLNRTNRSGIVSGGPIGGRKQDGKYKLDARFNRVDLQNRIRRLSKHRSRISVHGEDAIPFMERQFDALPPSSLVFADPPYFGRGDDLYANPYTERDHELLAELFKNNKNHNWIITYDDHPRIRDLYAPFRQVTYSLSYSAQSRYRGSELLIVSERLAVDLSLLPGVQTEFFPS